MFSAYFYQAVNLAVSILLVPLLLNRLTTHDYTIWLIFAAIAGLAAQLQTALQGVAVKEVARTFHTGVPALLTRAIRQTRSAYDRLALLMAGPVVAGGIIYLILTQHVALRSTQIIAYVIFIWAYALSFYFSPNNTVLIGTGRIRLNSNLNTMTRGIYLVGVLAALGSGVGLPAMGASLFVAVLFGGIASALAVRRHHAQQPDAEVVDELARPQSDTLRYGAYSLTAFLLYNGAYLIVAAAFPTRIASAYGLALQIFVLLNALALVPLQVWLARLMRAIAVGDHSAAIVEMVRTLLATNIVFAAGFAGLVVVGRPLLALLHSHVELPPLDELFLFFAAFAIEVNIATLVNAMTASGDYRFFRRYVIGAIVGLAGAVAAALATHDIRSFLVVPLIVQTATCLPAMTARACALLGARPIDLIVGARTVIRSYFGGQLGTG